jgi:hypothetical protein
MVDLFRQHDSDPILTRAELGLRERGLGDPEAA